MSIRNLATCTIPKLSSIQRAMNLCCGSPSINGLYQARETGEGFRAVPEQRPEEVVCADSQPTLGANTSGTYLTRVGIINRCVDMPTLTFSVWLALDEEWWDYAPESYRTPS